MREELQYIHHSVQNNFSGYTHSRHLRESSDQVFAEVLSTSTNCNSQTDYVRSIRRYLASFHDPHVKANWFGVSKYGELIEVSSGKKINPERKKFQLFATGIYLTNYSNRFFVKQIDSELLKDSDLRIGDELKNCSGNSPTEILKDEILPYESVSAYGAAFCRKTPNIFIRWDEADETQIKCNFLRSSTPLTVTLAWHEVPENYVELRFLKPPTKIYEIEKIH